MTLNRSGLGALILLGALAAAGSAHGDEPNMPVRYARARQPGRKGELAGKVTQGPVCVVGKRDAGCRSQPATGVQLQISTPSGSEIKSVVTDEEGRYNVSLLPGTYRMRMAALGRGGRSEDLPATVTIIAGKQTTKNIFIETEGGKVQPLRQTGVLFGKVARGPMSPLGGIGRERLAEPVVGARLLIYGSGGQQIKPVVTDAKGEYRVSLPPGTYRIEMGPVARGMWTKDLPATVTITKRRETRLDILMDTGIR